MSDCLYEADNLLPRHDWDSWMRRFLLGFVLGVLLLPLGALLAAWFGAFSIHANDTAPVWEKALARRALNTAVARKAPKITNPVTPTDDNLLAGMKIFRDGCAGRHGARNNSSDYDASC